VNQVHGSSTAHVSEATPLNVHTPSPSLVSWRPEVESQVLASRDVIDVVIIRPALLYGGNGTIWNIFLDPIFNATKTGAKTVEAFGTPTTPITLVHKDDLADVYVRVVERVGGISSLEIGGARCSRGT
jgi:nucleoside-diphosphate-sugar epimerase